MPLTKDQATSLINKAKQRKPNLTRDEAKSILSKANQRVSTKPSQSQQIAQRSQEQGQDFLGGVFSKATDVLSNVPKYGKAFKSLKDMRQRPEVRQAIRGAIQSRYRNVDKEPNLITRFARGVSKAAPAVGSTIAGVAGRPFGRGVGAVAAGAGYGAGQAAGESLENLLGIQDETPQELAREAVTKPVMTAGVDYGMDLASEKVLKPFVKSVGRSIKMGAKALGDTKVGRVIGKPISKITKKIPKVIKEDLIAKLKPTKSMRTQARERGIDLSEEVFRYSDDALKNIDLADRQITQANARLTNILKEKQGGKLINVDEVLDDITKNLRKNQVRTSTQKKALETWKQGIKQRIKDLYGSPNKLNLTGAVQEKSLAGVSGYKDSGDVVESLIGKADAQLERNLRDRILSSTSGAEKLRLEKLLREQEKGIFMKQLFENAADSQIPLEVVRRFGRLINPISGPKYLAKPAVEAGVGVAQRSMRPPITGPRPSSFIGVMSQSTKQSPNLLQEFISRVPRSVAPAATTELVQN